VNSGFVPGSRRDELVALVDAIGSEAAPDLVVLPELAVPGYPADSDPARDRVLLEELSEPLEGGPSVAAFAAAAHRNDLLVAVGLSERAGSELYDTLAVVGAEGVVGSYRKVHLTPSERAFWSAGTEAVTAASRLGTLGLAICYDRMFPEGFRRMRERGAELFLVASAWSAWPGDELVDGDIWNEHGALFDRARAAENGVVLVSANWTGPKGPATSDRFGGGARVVDGLGRDAQRTEDYSWGSVWEIDLAASAARVRHVNGGDFFARDSAPFA
jgi:predicted amidohydrolase